MMKILLITQDYHLSKGGIQSYCLHLVKEITNLQHEVTVICPGRKNETTIKNNITMISFKITSSLLFFKLWFFLPHFFKTYTFDHVLLAQWQNGIPFLGMSKKHPFKLHCMVLGRELLDGVFGRLTPFVSSLVYRLFDSVVPCSEYVKTLFQKQNPSFTNIEVIHPGVDSDFFIPKQVANLKEKLKLSDKKIITTITRLVARKNVALIIKSMSYVLKKEPKAHLVIGGIGPEFDTLKQLVCKEKMSKHITMVGKIPEDQIVEYFSLGDVFVLPSYQTKRDVEGFGIVFLEAGACEVPVISAATGGICDAIENKKTGFLINDVNHSSLTSSIVQILENPIEGKKMGTYARQRVLKNFKWTLCAEHYLNKVFL